ncbi:unnamed protein product [Amoebophrya sp. A120]|nr:unnamed protein product [Amoebophrya sp. A120]|eukprot:GSA120T00011852001.1
MELNLVKAQPLRSVYVRADVNAFEAVIDPSIREVYSDNKFHTSTNAKMVEQYILQSGEQKGFQTRDKEILWNMEINTFQVRHEVAKEWSFFVSVMGLSHSQKVAADHLQLVNRWSGRKIIVIIADHGFRGHGAHEFFQIAIALHTQLGANVLMFESPPEFERNVRDYVEIMPSIILKILDFYRIHKFAAFGLGYGGAVAFRLYMLAPVRFSSQAHVMINPRFPEGVELPERFDIVKTMKRVGFEPSQFWLIRLQRKLDQDGLPIKSTRITHEKRKISDKILEDSFQSLLQRVMQEIKGLKKRSPDEVRTKNGAFFDEVIFSQDIHYKNMHWFRMFPHDPQTLLILFSRKMTKCLITYFVAQRFPFQHEVIPMPGSELAAVQDKKAQEAEEEEDSPGQKKGKKKRKNANASLREMGIGVGAAGTTSAGSPSVSSPAMSLVKGQDGQNITASSGSGFENNLKKEIKAGEAATSNAAGDAQAAGENSKAAEGSTSLTEAQQPTQPAEGDPAASAPAKETLLPPVGESPKVKEATPAGGLGLIDEGSELIPLEGGGTISLAELQSQQAAAAGEADTLMSLFGGEPGLSQQSDDVPNKLQSSLPAIGENSPGHQRPGSSQSQQRPGSSQSQQRPGSAQSQKDRPGSSQSQTAKNTTSTIMPTAAEEEQSKKEFEAKAEEAKAELRRLAAEDARKQESTVNFGLIREMDAIVNRPEELGYNCFGELASLAKMRKAQVGLPDPNKRPVLIGKEINPLRKLRMEERQNEIMRKMAVGGLDAEAEEKKERQRAVKYSVDLSAKNLAILERENEDLYNKKLLEIAQQEEAQLEKVRRHDRRAMASSFTAGPGRSIAMSSTVKGASRFGTTTAADQGKKMQALKDLLAQPAVAPAEVLVGPEGAAPAIAGIIPGGRQRVELAAQVPVNVDSFEDENALAEVYRSRLADAQRATDKEETDKAKKIRHEQQHTTREMRLVALMQQRKEMEGVKKLYDEQQRAVKYGDPETRKMEAVLQMSREEFENDQAKLEASLTRRR